MAADLESTKQTATPSSFAAFGVAGLAIALYIGLIDGAVETFRSGSPLRWWVVGVVAVYLAVTVALWRYRPSLWQRMGWSGRANNSFFLLLGLLAFTVWLPGGLSDGLRVAGQSTSRVLSLFTTVVIVLAGVSLVRLSWLPRWAKIVAGLLATYGLAAFAAGIVTGVEFAALLQGDSLWTRLPSWLQGAFLGALVVVPAALLLHAAHMFKPAPGASRVWDIRQGLAMVLSLVMAGSAITSASGVGGPTAGKVTAVEISERGAGMRRQSPDTLKLPVPRTFDLTYVNAANFATALGNDPVRIFNYVRDEIAYEVYTGCLRGPRGTLLAMAGNSLDRASLLASMLQHAGQKIRYAHGTLPETVAKELVTSMWAEPPEQPSVRTGTQPSPAVKSAADTLVNGVRRDYALIRDRLKRANIAITSQSAPTLDSLVKEAQDHYWVQWLKGGKWVDLDTSFSDSSPDTKYAPVAATSDALPEALFHQVEMRIRLEEYMGGQVTSRVILAHTAKAADLSGVDMVLSHQPENWTGPADSLEEAMASTIQDTGRIKPVLLVGEKDWIAGAPFYPKQPAMSGMGGVFSALGGIGTRKGIAIATAESIEFDFVAPNSGEAKVVRGIFDMIGPGRRAANKNLTAQEVQANTQVNASDVTRSVFDLFLTTGRIDESHLSGMVSIQDSTAKLNVSAALRRLNTAYTFMSDLLLHRLSKSDRTSIVFYPDSPRVQVAELSAVAGKERLSLDLRRDRVRTLALGPHPEDVFVARTFRGVTDGTLERFLIDYLIDGSASGREQQLGFSTSLLFERAEAEGVQAVMLARGDSSFRREVSEDTRARINEEFARGFLVLAPERPISLDGQPRFAWWRIDPRSGEVTGVTDEGLNQVEYKLVVKKNLFNQIESAVLYGTPVITGAGELGVVFSNLTQGQYYDLIKDVRDLLGGTISYRGLY